MKSSGGSKKTVHHNVPQNNVLQGSLLGAQELAVGSGGTMGSGGHIVADSNDI